MESELIEYCAPTLAGLKSASLFSYFFTDKSCVIKKLNQLNNMLNERGVYVTDLIWREKSD